MKQEEILTAVKGVLNEQLVSEIARHFAEADKDFRENIVLRDRVDWLEKQLADASAVLDKKQPEAQTFELPTMEQIRTSSYNMARRENYYDSLRGRSKYLFNIKEEN